MIALIGATSFEEGCGEGCCGYGSSIGDLSYESSIGDIYDDISTYHQQTADQMRRWGVKLTDAQWNGLTQAFQAIQRAVGAPEVYGRVEDAHRTTMQLIAIGLGHQASPDQAQVMLDHFHRLQSAVPGGKGFWGGVADVAAVAAPIVGGIVGSVVPGLGTVVGAGLGTIVGGAIKGGAGGAVDAGANYTLGASLGGSYNFDFSSGLGLGSEPSPVPPAMAAQTTTPLVVARFNKAANLAGTSVASGVSSASRTAGAQAIVPAASATSGGGMRPLALLAPSPDGSNRKVWVAVGAVALVGGFLAWRSMR